MKVRKKKLNFFDRIFLWLNILVSAALLISYLSPVTDPRKHWIVAFFGLGYPLLLLTSIVLLAYWLLRRSNIWLLPALTIAIGWNVLFNNIGLRFSESPDTQPREGVIRLMTYNAHNFKPYGAKNDLSTKHAILDLITKQRPDIIGFQEFYTRPRGQYDIIDSLKAIMHSAHYYFEPFGFNNGHEAMGMAIFSRYPIVNHGNIRLSDEGGSSNQCLFTDVKKNNRIFRVYSIHLQSIRFDPTDYDYLDKVSQHAEANLTLSKRIGGKLKRAFIKRSEQVFKVKAHAAQCPYPYVISGDFNDTPASFAVSQMCKGLKNAFREKGSGMGRTYNGSFPNYQIDYIMASPAMEVDNYWIVKKKLSDHYPVCSDLMLK